MRKAMLGLLVVLGLLAGLGAAAYAGFEDIVEALDARYAREIDEWLATTVAAWAEDATTVERLPPGEPPPNGFFCGPEVWGEGLLDPPAGSWPPVEHPEVPSDG